MNVPPVVRRPFYTNGSATSILTESVLLVGTHLSFSKFNHSVGEDLAERLAWEGWNVIRTSEKTARVGRLVDMLSTCWLRRADYTVAQVDVFSGLAFGWAEAVCWTLSELGKPYVLTLHGGNLPQFALKWPRRVHRLLKSAAVVTAPSRYLLELMRPYREDLILLPNPLDVERYIVRSRSAARPRLIWLRAFHKLYNPTLAVKAVARLWTEFPDVHLTMIGPDKDGSLRPARESVSRLGIDRHVSFQGGIPHREVPRWLSKADIFINSANLDNTPVSVLEAMATGLCVVSTDVGGIPYLLTHEHDALLVPPDDPAAMAAAVRRILTEPQLAGRLSRNARQTAERCAWSIVLPRWKVLLEGAVRGG